MPDEEIHIDENQMSLIETFETNYRQNLAQKYIAEYDWDTDDGTWIVWDGRFHHRIGLTETEARKIAEDLNGK
jgi:hypothetical protein